MRLRGDNHLIALAAALLAACSPAADQPAAPANHPPLGLMSSLPLYWPVDAALADIAAGTAPLPWQRRAVETRYRIVPLDTLSPMTAGAPDKADVDPLAGLQRLAVIQPRGLSPADNVALDDWVRAGGRLVMVLDPALTGEYEAPLGDPRRPVDSALIPPVVARWGLTIAFDETQPLEPVAAPFAEGSLPLVLPGQIAVAGAAANACTLAANAALATCRVGKGKVTLIADAALFEHPELAGEAGAGLAALLAATLN